MSSRSNSPSDSRNNALHGILAMLAATSLFACMDAMVKVLMADYSVVQVLFFRAGFGLLPLVPLVWRAGLSALATGRPMAHLARSSVGLAAVACFFLAFRSLPLVQVTAIGFAAPLLITALSVPLLHERVGPRRWAAVVVGFAGILVVAGPDVWVTGGWSAGLGFALAGTFLYALVMVMMRIMGRTEAAVTTVFWFSVLTLAVTGAGLPLVWRSPDPGAWVLFAAAGTIGGIGQLLISQAVRLAPASVVAPFDYFHIVVSSTLGWLVFADIPTLHTLAGAVVVIGSGLYLLAEERRSQQAG